MTEAIEPEVEVEEGPDFSQDEPLDPPPSQEEIDVLLKEHPNTILFAPPSYGPLDRDAEGSWMVVSEGKSPVAVVWTDWQNGAGVIPIKSSETASKLLRYFVVNKMMNAPAGIAFSSVAHVEGISVGEVVEGTLSTLTTEVYSLAKEVSNDSE